MIKKDGSEQEFDSSKIFNALLKATVNAGYTADDGSLSKAIIGDITDVTDDVSDLLEEDYEDSKVPVDHIQDLIIDQLLDTDHKDISREYIQYSTRRKQLREDAMDINKAVEKVLNSDPQVIHENGNKDARNLATKRDLIAGEVFRAKGLKMLPKDIREAHLKGYIHWHDSDFGPVLPYSNCCNINIEDMLKNGFEINETRVTQPHSIGKAVTIASEVLETVSNSQYGGTSLADIDVVLSPYAKMNYSQHLKDAEQYGVKDKVEYATELTKKDIYEAMQSLEYNINFEHGNGGQTPFTTVSCGMGTDFFAREIQKAMLNVRIKGMDGKTAIFPKLIFFVKRGINLEPEDPNYDIKQLALKCCSLRDYPDIVFADNMLKITGGKHRAMTPMGCVRGQSLVSYKYGGNIYTTSFDKMYDQFSDKEKIQENGIDRYIDLKGVTIKDSHTGTVKYVDCLRVIKNVTPHKWLRIYANAGKVFECTDNHPLEVSGKGRVLAKDLKIGDKLVSSIPLIQEPQGSCNKNDIDMAWLLGVVICDGCLSEHSETLVSYALDGENEIRDKVGALYSKEYLRDTEHHRGKKGNYREVAIKDSNFRDTCVKYFKGVTKNSRVVPDFVFGANREVQLGFLSGMIDADGYVNKRAQKVQIGSVNKALAFGQYELMDILGLCPKVYVNHFNKKNAGRIRYRVECRAPKELANYIQCEKKKTKISLNHRTNKSKDTGEITRIEPMDIDEPCYDVTTESDFFDVDGIVSHNCRSFLPTWVNPKTGKEQVGGRLNCGVVTLNLPRLALEANGDKEKFKKLLVKYAELVHKALRLRIDRVRQVKPIENPILWMEGAIARLGPNDDVTPILKGGRCTASFGYIGIYEAVSQFYGLNWENNNKAHNFAEGIVKYIHDKCHQWYEEEGYWYSEYGTPQTGGLL